MSDDAERGKESRRQKVPQGGKVGIGLGKGREVSDCIRKGTDAARRNMIPINLTDGTIPHRIDGKFGATTVVMRPATPGTGVIAGGAVRVVLETLGVQDILAKVLGSRNVNNVVRATLNGLELLRTREQEVSFRERA